MESVFLAAFDAGKRRYELTLNTATGDTQVHDEASGELVFRTNPGGWVHGRAGTIAGRFRRQEGSFDWYYASIDEGVRVNTKFEDWSPAQVHVFKTLLAFGQRG